MLLKFPTPSANYLAEKCGGNSYFINFAAPIAVVAQLVEHQLPKLRVASSSLVYRSIDKTLVIS